MTRQLIMWTIFDRPRDHPHGFLARAFVIGKGAAHPTDQAMTGPLEQIRRDLQRRGLVCVNRSRADPPQVLESWI